VGPGAIKESRRVCDYLHSLGKSVRVRPQAEVFRRPREITREAGSEGADSGVRHHPDLASYHIPFARASRVPDAKAPPQGGGVIGHSSARGPLRAHSLPLPVGELRRERGIDPHGVRIQEAEVEYA